MISDLLRGQVLNFTDANSLDCFCYVADHLTNPRPLVTLKTDEGALSFQFSMRPEQARELAALLVQAAELTEQAFAAREDSA